MKPLTSEQKLALTTLRDRMGGVSEQKRQAQKHLNTARKSIRKLLETHPATVPAIAEALNLPADEALWHVTGMRKYGDVTEVGEEGDYPLYSVVVVGEKAAAGH